MIVVLDQKSLEPAFGNDEFRKLFTQLFFGVYEHSIEIEIVAAQAVAVFVQQLECVL